MNHPDEDLIVMLAIDSGDGLDSASPDHDRVRSHLRECPPCQAIYDDIIHTMDVVRASRDVGSWQAPSPSVLNAVMLDVLEAPTATVTPLRLEPRRADRHRARPAMGWLVGVAAAGVVLGWGVGQIAGGTQAPPVAIPSVSPSTPAPTQIAAVGLDTLDTNEPRGDAEVLRKGDSTALVVNAADLDQGDGFLEVWLINTDGKRMVSVGVLEGSSATFPISKSLLAEGYLIVDVSREHFDSDTTHSGDSVVRGTLTI